MEKEEPYEVDEVLMAGIYSALKTAADNANEVYNDHMHRLGKHPMTTRNKYVAGLLKKDIDEVEKIIDELEIRWNFDL